MALVVQKYGDTSVETTDAIKLVAKRVIDTYNAGNDVVVVVSAQTGETNRLIALTKEFSTSPEGPDYDVVVSTGEQITTGLLSLCLNTYGYKAAPYLGWQMPVITDSDHARAKISTINTARIQTDLQAGVIVIVAGFQGIDANGRVTTLGRGGSDITAVALADALDADICEIFTDLDGIYTADLKICKEARKIDRISYDEMLELASLGDQVLQVRALEYAKLHNVKIYVRSKINQTAGTLVTMEDRDMERNVVSGVVYDRNEAKIAVLGVPDKPGIAAKILTALADADISVDMIVQNVSQAGLADVTFSVSKTDLAQASSITTVIAAEIQAKEVITDENISKISIVGLGMRNHAGVAASMFSALAFNNINIQMISTSEIKVAVAIEEKYTELAVRVLHEKFSLAC
jgi:aspartate kinase